MGHVVSVHLTFCEVDKLFSRVIIQFCIPTNMSGSATCSSFLPPHGIVLGMYSSHSAKYLWHLSFNLHFSTEQLCCSSFHMLICYWCDLFGKVFISFIKRFYLCIFREKGRERERRERNIDVREKRQSVVSHAGPEWGLKLQPRHVP